MVGVLWGRKTIVPNTACPHPPQAIKRASRCLDIITTGSIRSCTIALQKEAKIQHEESYNEMSCDLNQWQSKWLKVDGEWDAAPGIGSTPFPSPKPSITPIEEALRGVIDSTMSCTDVVSLLTQHGCTDLTSSLDKTLFPDYPIAHGGLGDVFRAKLIDGSPIAIKTIRAYGISGSPAGKYQKRAAKELYTWSKCKHPNVVSLMGLAVFRNTLAMISLWEGNGNLLQYLSTHGSADRCRLSTSICAGLAYLHENQIIHGDLKGANVLIAEDGTPKLTDFGNAQLVEGTLQFTQTSTGPKYSPRWTAPEILKGKSAHTLAGDIYALGMTILVPSHKSAYCSPHLDNILQEAFTGKVPFANKSDPALYHTCWDEQTDTPTPTRHHPRDEHTWKRPMGYPAELLVFQSQASSQCEMGVGLHEANNPRQPQGNRR
ncbi:hypothetical protein OPQ81_008516 [Rhizoctonia solani]|nr:hypothetical protein OPQ81_008516 [Rhizoctonia solani]